MLAQGDKKVCSSCKQKLNISSFNRNKVTQDGFQNACKSCKAKMNKNWKYALNSGQYEAMRITQNQCCAICKEESVELVIDHDHKTGKLRSLLCRKCNSLLGMCNDNIQTLLNAIEYLKV